MRIIAALDVDLDTTPLGTTSRQSCDLSGQPVLRRTIDRVARAKRLAGIYLVFPEEQVERCRALLGEAAATIRPTAAGDPPYRRLMRTARKWSLDGWRGGMGGASALDEYAHCAVLAGLAAEAQADAVWVCSGAAAVVDPAVIDGMIEHYEASGQEMQLTFAPAPPGLVGTVFETGLLKQLGQQNVPPGWILAYKPEAPQMDLAFKECCFPTAEAMRHAAGRLIVDTRRALETVCDLLADHPDPDGETAGRWLIERSRTHVPPFPREVEIELTTEDQLPETSLRPRGQRVPQRGPIDPALVAAVADALGDYDDSLVVLGGFGEPLLHPQFGQICRILSESRVYGVAVRTNGLGLDDHTIETLVCHRVDVVNVMLDAWSAALYQRLNPGRELAPVLSALDRLTEARAAAKQVEPLVVPQITKSVETVQELDDFFDGWIRKVGWAVVDGYSHYAGQLEDRSVVDMSPPTRTPCRRIRTRCTILADGRMTLCDQDFTARTAVGSLHDASLADLWRSSAMQAARDHHAAGRCDALPLCPSCNEWHRP
ncbi:MAG: SPASM domain-containing protein [Planctomycetota bacterium]|jgi:spore coat polysaccharide biosynthesis protein SpsF (cytidylyltransferase family)